ncbi:MAG: hypothetical protein ABI889_13545 [Gemmatimonadota bacterium]
MRNALFVLALTAGVLAGCKKTADGDLIVEKPRVTSETDTVNMPHVTTTTDTVTTMVPVVGVKKETTTVKVPKITTKP